MDTLATLSFTEAFLAAGVLTVLWFLCTVLWRFTRPRIGPFAWPIVGAFPEVMWNYYRYHDWISDNYKKYGGTIVVPIPLDSLTYVADPACVEYMLKTNFKNYPKGNRDREILMELLGSGIFNADGEDWTLQRKTAVHEFSVKKLREHATVVFQEQVGALVRKFDQAAKQGTVVDLQDLIMRLTLESICQIGFGVRLGSLTSSDASVESSEIPEASEFARAFDLANRVAAERFVTPIIWKVKRFLRIGEEGQMQRAVEAINRFADRVIQKRRDELRGKENAKGVGDVTEGNGQSKAGRSDGTGNVTNGTGAGTKKPGFRTLDSSENSSDSDEGKGEAAGVKTESQRAKKRYPLEKERWTLVDKSDAAPKSQNLEPSLPPSPKSSVFGKAQISEPLDSETQKVLNPEPQDLLSRFMSMRNRSGALYSDTYLRDVILNFIIAGRDTSAGAISWLFYELSRNSHVEEKIFQELRETMGAEQADGEKVVERLTFERLRKLTYLQAALSETLRLHPSVPQDRKTAVDSDVLPDGTKIPRGAFVVWTAYTMGRQESIWGPDALGFRPERWLKMNGMYQAESAYKFTAFQGGPRMCLGKDLAFLEMKAAAAALIYNFRFQVVPGYRVTYAMALTLPVKGGLPVTVTKRWDY